MAEHDVVITQATNLEVGNADLIMDTFSRDNGIRSKVGTLKLSRGAIVWIPARKAIGYCCSWEEFNELMCKDAKREKPKAKKRESSGDDAGQQPGRERDPDNQPNQGEQPMLILTDIDGVLADPCQLVANYLSKDKKDWQGYFKHVGDMPPIPSVVGVINGLILWEGSSVYFCTGRPESNRIPTCKWLNHHIQAYVPDERVLMRPNGDRRSGADLKLAWALKLHPDLIFDDEPETAELLKSWGFTVAHILGFRYSGDPIKDQIPD